MIPGDRVRVTAGDLCGETGTVICGVPHGLVEVEWDEGGEFHIDPDRLEKVDLHRNTGPDRSQYKHRGIK